MPITTKVMMKLILFNSIDERKLKVNHWDSLPNSLKLYSEVVHHRIAIMYNNSSILNLQ